MIKFAQINYCRRIEIYEEQMHIRVKVTSKIKYVRRRFLTRVSGIKDFVISFIYACLFIVKEYYLCLYNY